MEVSSQSKDPRKNNPSLYIVVAYPPTDWKMLPKKMYSFFIWLMILFFLFLIVYQVIYSWTQQRNKDDFYAYNAFGFGCQGGEHDGFKRYSFGHYGIFNPSLFGRQTLIEGLKNDDNGSGSGSGSGSTPTLEELAAEVADLSNNLYNFAGQLNMSGQQAVSTSGQNLPSEPIQVSGTD